MLHLAMSESAVQARIDDRNPRTEKLAESLQLAAYLARVAPDVRVYVCCVDAARIIGRARQLAALAVTDCNRGLSSRQETRRENLRRQIEEIAALYGAKASCSGDPRGYVVRLHHPEIERNGWGDGFGVA